MKKLLLIVLLVLTSLVVAYTSTAVSSPVTHPPAQAATPPPADSFPPLVVSIAPERGAEQPLNQPLELTFDQPMDRASVESAFAIEPGASVDGALTWLDDRTVQFAFNDGFRRGERYRVRVVETARSQAGVPLNRPFEFNFSAVGFLEVANVQPAGGAAEILADTKVVVMFNRPVVPLAALGQGGGQPDPLTFVPPVTGQGEWLNTAAYQFTPDSPGFQPATAYTARVAQGLADVTGQAVLVDDFEWQFTTVSPAVAASIPANGDIYVSPTPVISVAFNQLMDHQSVEQNLLLLDDASGQPVPGDFSWQAGGLLPPPDPADLGGYPGETLPEPQPVGQETVMFSPAEPLTPGAAYQLLVPQGVSSSLGTVTGSDYSAAFTVSPQPVVLSSNPADGEQFADIWQGLEITFNAPMNPASVALGQNLIIEPKVAATDVYTYWSNSDTVLSVNFPRQENSAYTVTLRSDIEGRYGQPLGQETVINWQTLRQSPYVFLVSPKIGVYNGYQPETYIYMTVRNVSQVNFELYRLPAADFLRLSPQSYRGFQAGYEWDQYTPEASDLLGQWQQPVEPAAFENYVYKVDVSQAVTEGQPLPPGLYYLEASVDPADFYPEAQNSDPATAIDRQILIVTKRSLTVKQGRGDILTWLTDLQSGQPVAEAPISFTRPDGQSSQGVTDAEGVATFTYQATPDNSYAEMFVFSGNPDKPDDDFAVASNNWSAGIESYDFSHLYEGGGFTYSRPYGGVIYTERRLYRPGQTVYFKGIVRLDDDARYQIPTGLTTTVTIYDAQYRQIYSEALPLNEFGSFNGSFVLDEEASLGGYQIEASLTDPVWQTVSVGYNSFSVAEYRKPEFLVEAAADKSEYRAGETIKLDLESSFFSGGPVANAPVRWTLLSDNYYFDYQGEGYYDFTNEDNIRSNDFNPNYSYGFGEQIASGAGQTDANGRFSLEIPADLTGRLTSQTFTFDLAVTGLNNQEVAAQVRAIVHKGDFYVGLQPVSSVGRIGEPNEVEVLVVDWQSRPVAGQAVEVVVTRQDWYSVQQVDPEASRLSADEQYYWTNLVENVAVFTTTVTTAADGTAVASFTPDDGGSYKVYARTVDQNDQQLFASTFIWVTGYQYVNWGQEDHDRIELIADKPEYSTGDTANILVPHPYSGTVTALVTLERGRIHDHFVTELQTNSDQLEIPVTAEMSPNIYVSVFIVKGMTSPEAEGQGDDLPGFKMGYARLNVNPAEKRLNISLTPVTETDSGYYLPGDEVTYEVNVTDFQGRPVEAELSLALIDKAVLTLAPDIPDQLENAFWQRRALDVRTGASLTLALDRINRALDERKGGGGGEGPGGPDSVRQNFADTAFWLADFTTDANGQGSFEVTLPDNLTTWVLLTKGVTGDDTLVGEASVEIVTSKPLLVRSVTPRFVVVGDEVQIGLIAQNNTAETLTVTPVFSATGLEIGEWRRSLANSGEAWQPASELAEIELAPGAETKVDYRVTVPEAEEARLTMGVSAAGSDYSDAVAFSLPVYRLNTPETVATVGVMPNDGTRQEGIVLPPPGEFDPNVGGLTVNIEPSLAAGMQAGLTYLRHFPYECVEQTVSTFLPNIFTARAVAQVGLSQPELSDELDRQVTIGLQKLYSQQNVDGGWGWWPGEASNPTLTAYVTLGLVEARREGFTVEDWVLQNALSYLQASLVAPQDIAAPWQANQQAFVLYVLAEAGQSDLGRMMTLFDQRQQLDYYGRAFLALAMHLADPTVSQIKTLINDLTSAAVTSATGAHWEEQAVDAYAMNTDVRSTAIIIAALARIQPDHPLLPEAVRWLMTVRSRQQAGYWSTTQETAWAIIGLTDWLVASGDLEADYRWQASLNGQGLGQGQADSTNLDQTTSLTTTITDLLAGAVNRLAIERDSPPPASGGGEGGDSSGSLYYAAYLSYARPVNEVKALDRGIIVSRQYSLDSSEGEEEVAINEANVGDFVQVKLTLIAPTDLNYVLVEDYLPAGVEAVDSSLATTSVVGQPPEISQAGSDEPWGWWYFTHTDLRDEKAVLFATYLPQGVYEYTYTVRAAIPGEYGVSPTHAEQMYFPEVFGRSDGGVFRVKE